MRHPNAKIFFFLMLTYSNGYAQDLVNGMDLNRINWPFLCPNVGAIQFSQLGTYCEISHPASKLHNSEVFKRVIEVVPQINVCEHLTLEYNTLTAPQNTDPEKAWGFCYIAFKSSLFNRITAPESYQHNTQDWINAHFNQQTILK